MSTQYKGKGENFYSLGDNSDWSLSIFLKGYEQAGFLNTEL